MTASTTQPPFGTHPNSARGEVLLPITEGETRYPVRFSLRTLHDFTQTTGHKLMDLGVLIVDDFVGIVGQLVTSAVRCYVPAAALPAAFQIGDALDLIERLSPAENKALMEAIMQAIRIDENPLFQALMAQAPKPAAPAATSGGSTNDSPTAN